MTRLGCEETTFGPWPVARLRTVRGANGRIRGRPSLAARHCLPWSPKQYYDPKATLWETCHDVDAGVVAPCRFPVSAQREGESRAMGGSVGPLGGPRGACGCGQGHLRGVLL